MKASSKFAVLNTVIDGEDIEIPIISDLTIHDVNDEMDIVAAQIGYWGNVLAAAMEDLAAADAVYRNWRAQCVESYLEDDPRLAEWKIKAKIESDSSFMKYKGDIARCNRNVAALQKIVEGYGKKANLLQSRGANLRTELEKTGINVSSSPDKKKTKKTSNPPNEKVEKVRSIFKNTDK